jgi:hypothetical protein
MMMDVGIGSSVAPTKIGLEFQLKHQDGGQKCLFALCQFIWPSIKSESEDDLMESLNSIKKLLMSRLVGGWEVACRIFKSMGVKHQMSGSRVCYGIQPKIVGAVFAITTARLKTSK